MEIPGNSYYSSQVLELEEVVVEVGEYYYINKIRGIEKISKKRKRGETNLSQGSSNRSIEWKVGLDPKDNAMQISSSPNAFTVENAMSVYELVVALDTSQVGVVELEEVLRTHTKTTLLMSSKDKSVQ
jgi:hypothetical protein